VSTALTPETLTRHELNGLSVRVSDADNDDAAGISGRVVRETERTLVIEGADGIDRTIPKAGATFAFDVPEESSDRTVSVEGDRLVANPARRTERTRPSKWR
jgi:ribonuclease P protein subunit POP4